MSWIGSHQSRREKVTKMWLTLIRNGRIKMNKSKSIWRKVPVQVVKNSSLWILNQSHFLLCPQANQCQIFQKIHYWLEIFNLKLNLQDFIKKKLLFVRIIEYNFSFRLQNVEISTTPTTRRLVLTNWQRNQFHLLFVQ